MAFTCYYPSYLFPATSYMGYPSVHTVHCSDSPSDSSSSSDSDSSTSSEEPTRHVMCWPWTELKLEDPPARPRKQARYLVHPGYQQYVYLAAGYQYAYQYPYQYNTSALPAGTQMYLPHQGVAAFAPPHFTTTTKDDKKDKKKSKSKKKKSRSKPKTTHHAWYGRTANEVFEDEIKTAAREGVYGTRDIAPNDPKPSDMFWVIPYEHGQRPKLLSHYEIMDLHKPGRWQMGSDGNLRWHKEPKESSGESSDGESSASEWEN